MSTFVGTRGKLFGLYRRSLLSIAAAVAVGNGAGQAKTPESKQEFLAGPVTPSLVERGALYAKLRWAIDTEIGKTNPDVARYAETEAGVWPNMTKHPVIPEVIIQARNEWWQKELGRVGVRIVDPALKGALARTGPGD